MNDYCGQNKMQLGKKMIYWQIKLVLGSKKNFDK